MKDERDALEEKVEELELECRLLTAQHDRRRDERDALEGKVEKLEREVRLMRQQYFRRVEERDALRESVKDLLDLTEYGDIGGMVWELVNDGDEWVVERLNRAQKVDAWVDQIIDGRGE
jgi:chromosome segregation ATPase